MGIFSKVNPIELAKDAFSLIDQAVVDKDLKLQLQLKVQEMSHQMRLAELGTETIPWVDALHKMGRQIISLVTVLGIIAILITGIELSQQDLLAIVTAAAPGSIYNWVKGKGK